MAKRRETPDQMEHRKATQREYYYRNREKILAQHRDKGTEASRAYYAANKDKIKARHQAPEYVERTRIAAAKYYRTKGRLKKQQNLQWFYDIRATLKCKLCGESHPACLQFHHIDPTIKDGNIGRMAWLARTEEAKQLVILEMEKCEVVCANCHFKLHWELTNKRWAQE